MALAFALFAVVAMVMGVLRQRGAWPLSRRAPIAPASHDAPLCGPPSIWHAGVLRLIEAAPFATLCEAMFRQDGCETAPASVPGADFGLLRRQGEVPPRRRLVCCQSMSALPVDDAALRGFAAVINQAHADAGIFIAAGAIDAAAVALARQHAITLVDGPALLKLIVQRSARQQRALRESATPPHTPAVRFRLDPTPAPAWFAAALAGVVAAWIAWPAPHEPAPLQAAYDAPARLATTRSPSDRAEPDPVRPPRSAPATAADMDPPRVIVPSPAAGRQILRCTDAGSVTYLLADGTCATGHGERITVFPTEGVNPFR